jgi:AcrR family transcriptional regulator
MTRRRKSLHPRKKPRQARAADTVAAVLEAAARILETKGFAGYNTNAVAARAGVSVGSLYQYFPHKDALTAALVERETAQLLTDLAAIPGDTDFASGVRRVIRAAIDHQMRRPALARLLDFEEERLPLASREQRVATEIVALMQRLLTRRHAPRVLDSELAALDVLAIVKGMVDAAGRREETHADMLQRRVESAVYGYLQTESAQGR